MILSQPFDNDKQVNFETLTGNITADIDDALASGIVATVDGHNIALYAEDNQLKLQIDTTIWPFPNGLQLSLQPADTSSSSVFAVSSHQGSFTVSCRASSPAQDYLAYLYAIWQSATMQQALLEKWQN